VKITVLVPSRGRPDRALAMYRSAMDTATTEDVEVRIIVDPDDPRLADYVALRRPGYANVRLPIRILEKRVGYTGSLNILARERWDDADVLGAFGDDVLFRTPGWDRIVAEALSTPGIAYGNDLVHAAGHPTAVFMSSVIAKALGYLAIPQSRHLWVDDAWKLLGQKTGTLRYLPELILEHMHPAVGKAEMDQTYLEVYDDELGPKDHRGFLDWEANHADADAEKVRAALGIVA
jgi:hypothetical protein